jgi:hypothetical protein
MEMLSVLYLAKAQLHLEALKSLFFEAAALKLCLASAHSDA